MFSKYLFFLFFLLTLAVNGYSSIGSESSLCEVNEYVKDGNCTACAVGKTNEAGDNPANQSTSCDGKQTLH